MSPVKKSYFPELTGIRAVLMYGIFNCHFNFIEPEIFGERLYRLGQEMHVGVPIFYVLSGFLIYYLYGHNLRKVNRAWAFEYAKNRVARIYPVYFVLLTFTYWWEGFPLTARETAITYTLTQAFFPDLVHAGIPQTWTLTIEETFYFTAPLLFLIALRVGLFIPCAAIVGLGIGLVAIDFPGNPYFGNPSHVFGRTICGTIACFGCGIALAKFVRRRQGEIPERSHPILTYSALAVALGIMLAQTELAAIAEANRPGGDLVRGAEHPLGFLLTYFVFPGVVVVWFWGMMTEDSAVRRFLRLPLIVLLGRASYCFYLLHFGAMTALLGSYVTTSRLGQFLLLNLISVLLFKYIEHPANQYIKFLGRPPKQSHDPIEQTMAGPGYAYSALLLVAVAVQLLPGGLMAARHGATAYELTTPHGIYTALTAALCLVAGMAFLGVWMRGGETEHDATAIRTPRWIWLAAATAALMACGMFVDWGARVFDVESPAVVGATQGPTVAARALSDFVRLAVVAHLGCLSLIASFSPGMRAPLGSVGVPLASRPLAVLFAATGFWYWAVDRNTTSFDCALALAVCGFAFEAWRAQSVSHPQRSRRRLATAAVGGLIVLMPVLWLSRPTNEDPRAGAYRLTRDAEQLVAEGRHGEALELALRATQLWSGDAQAHYLVGLCHYEQGDLDAARAAFHASIEAEPNSAEAHNALGVICLRSQQYVDAQRHFHAALRIDQHNVDATYYLGAVLESLGYLREAQEQYEVALRLDPTHAGARANLENLLARQADDAS